MLNELNKALKELPRLLQSEEIDNWKSLNINYHTPIVKRLYRQWGDYRINLHEISPCGQNEALYHPHPWPSAMIVLNGVYEMGIGYGPGHEEPPLAAKIIMKYNTCYEQTEPDSWHYIRPLTTTHSVMLTGKPWGKDLPYSELRGTLKPLSAEGKEDLFVMFNGIIGCFSAKVPAGV